MKKILLFIVFVLLSSFTFARDGGNLLIQLGVGGSSLEYGNGMDDTYDSFVDEGDGTRFSLYLDGLVGYAFMDHTYLTFSLSGIGDRVEASSYYYGDMFIQTNSYLFAIGLRTFPLKTGLYLGGDFGLTSMVIQADVPPLGIKGTETVYDNGYGIALKLGYDFDSNYKGPSLSLGSSLNYFKFEANDYYQEMDYFTGSIFVALNFR